jgi:hypothetical protein
MDKVTVDFQYEKNEYISAFREYLFKSKIIRKRDLALVGVMSAAEVFLLAKTGISIYSIIIGVILCFYAVIFGLLYFYQPLHVFKNSPKLHQRYTLTFTENNLQFKTNGISSDLKWNIYHELWSCRNFYYLIQAKNIYTIVPKRAFKNAGELQAFDKILKSLGIPVKSFR